VNLRSHVYLALLAHAANEAIRTGRFDPTAPNGDTMNLLTSVHFDAPLGSIPMRASIGAWRSDEARIAIAAWPTPDVDRWVEAFRANGLAGDVTAIGYLVREADGRLRLSNPFEPIFFMRQSRRAALQALPAPSDAADPLQLYPRYLSYAAAA
jgi:hypothetical protein